ncbi:MAG: tetratricopeptide repeat protein [Bacteroidales bacterium]|nr:tetratricopeptide repeat protein [Bacteroidales bacterium]
MKHGTLILLSIINLSLFCAAGDPVSDSLEARLSVASGEEKFNLLTSLSKGYSRSDPMKSLDFAEKAYGFAEESERTDWLVTSLNILAITHFNLGNNALSLKFFEKYFGQVRELIKSEGMTDAHRMLLIKGYNNTGNVLKDLGEKDQAMEAFLNALAMQDSVPEEHRNQALQINLMNNLGTVYIDLGEYDKAGEVLLTALDLSREKGLSLQTSITLNNLGLVAIETEDYTAALDFYHEAVEIGRKINDSIALGGYYNNIGMIFEKQRQWDEALEYYRHSLTTSQNLSYPYGIANTLGNIGNVYLQMRRYPESAEALREALKTARSTGIKSLVQKTYSYLFDLYNRQNMPAEALRYHLLYTAVKDSIFNEERSRQIADMEAKYETEKKEKENALLKKDIEIRKINQNLSLVAISGLSMLSVLLFMLFRARTQSLVKEKLIRKLEMDKKGIETKRLEEQVFAEQQINRLQQEKLAQQDRELAANVIQIMNKNNAMKAISQRLDEWHQATAEDRTQCYSEISGLIRNNLNLDDDWEEFKRHFIDVHPSFFDNLNRQYPGLTPHEQRMCAYLRINLDTKAIAQMLNVSPDAVVKSRYRLRKKMELAPETDLTEFMSRL